MCAKSSALYIGIYGCMNVGKSSLINMITGQNVAIVSSVAGTTTDPVKRSFELLGVGPAVLVDTAGIDDVADDLGRKRVEKTLSTLSQVDIALLIVASAAKLNLHEQDLIERFNRLSLPYILIVNGLGSNDAKSVDTHSHLVVNTSTGEGRDLLFSAIEVLSKGKGKHPNLLEGIVAKGDLVLLVTSIDSEAPAGRLILPQVNAIRSVIDNSALAIVAKEEEAVDFLTSGATSPQLVVVDSQLFGRVSKHVPASIPLTSFSILLSRAKGCFENFLEGTPAIGRLKDGDRVLLLESCSHQTSCDDIGRVKIPGWIRQLTGKNLHFDILAGNDQFMGNPSAYALVIQCGGCMVTQRQLVGRLLPFIDAGIPVTNYGMAIAYTQGIFSRVTEVFTKNKVPTI